MPDCHSDSKTVKQCTQTRDDGYAQCKETRDDSYSQCAEYKDIGHNQCSEYQDQGYHTCSEYQDEGYNTCSQWSNQGYETCDNWAKNCCTWKPCVWACNAFTWVCVGTVWVTNWVCLAWVWVTSMVCKAWIWVTNMVCVTVVWVANVICVVLAWVVNVVCIAWVWIKNVVCVAWAAIVYVFINICCMNPVWKALFKCWLPTKDTPRNPIEKPGWKLTFEDDFDSGAIDYTKWIDCISYLGRYSHGGEPVDYANGKFPTRYWSQDFTFGPSTVKLVADNTPVKTAVNTSQWSGTVSVPYTVQALQWKNANPLIEQHHGFFEIRCKTPNTRDMWPAFWLLPIGTAGLTKPPEIDIFEFMSRKPSIFTTTHHWLKGSKGTRHKACRASKRFHIYACRWDEKTIRWYLDNKLIRIAFKKDQGIGDFIYPMSVIVNSAVDDRACREPQRSHYPNYFEIDYVRAYKKL